MIASTYTRQIGAIQSPNPSPAPPSLPFSSHYATDGDRRSRRGKTNLNKLLAALRRQQGRFAAQLSGHWGQSFFERFRSALNKIYLLGNLNRICRSCSDVSSCVTARYFRVRKSAFVSVRFPSSPLTHCRVWHNPRSRQFEAKAIWCFKLLDLSIRRFVHKKHQGQRDRKET